MYVDVTVRYEDMTVNCTPTHPWFGLFRNGILNMVIKCR